MEKQKINKLIIAISVALKNATLVTPDPAVQVFLQSVIGEAEGKLLELPEGYPKIEDVLSASSEMVRTAVGDIMSELDMQKFSFDPHDKFLENWFKRNGSYSDKETGQIKEAFFDYINQIEVWAVKNPQILSQSIAKLRLDINQQALKIEKIPDVICRLQKIEKELHEIAEEQVSTGNKLFLGDCDKSNEEHFYNYFFADQSIAIDKFCLLDNYKAINLSEDCTELSQCKDKSNKCFKNIDEIIAIAKDQGILLITGMYGTGKTVLMKKLHYELKKHASNSVYFFHARDLIFFVETYVLSKKGRVTKLVGDAELRSLDEPFEELSHDECQIYIFIDELEELNIISDEENVYLELLLSWICSYQNRHSGYVFILASRKYTQLSEHREVCVADMLYERYYCMSRNRKMLFTLIHTVQFSSNARKLWIEKYSEENGNYVTYSGIKDQYGKIASALKVPIFLYAFMRKYLSSQNDSKNNIEIHGYYYYYSKFIEETIEGRFGLGQKASLIQTGRFSKQEFKNILRQIAYSILKEKEKYLSAEIYHESIVDEQPLLADGLTNIKFGIRLEELSEYMPRDEYEKASLINCYFFNMDAMRVYFTDTNILFALAAEHIYESIRALAFANNMEFQVDQLKGIELVRLYPHLVDYIIYLLKNDCVRRDLEAYLASFVSHSDIRCHYIDISDQDSGIVERVLLLYILFIKINRQSYKNDKYSHVFKEILYYVNAYKTHFYLSGKNEYAYTIERYFMNLNLCGLELKRVNLKSYNFQGSTITDGCRFVQCNFYESNVSNVVMDGTKFTLCNFDKVNQFSLKSNKQPQEGYQAVFDNCYIRQSSFHMKTAWFRNCDIKDLRIKLEKDSNVLFEKCTINKLSVEVHNNLKSGIPRFCYCVFQNTPSIPPFSSDEISQRIIESGSIVLT